MCFYNSILRKLLIILIGICSVLSAQAQEYLYPLRTNPVIVNYIHQHPASLSRIAAVSDTVILPFIDDFSRPGIYPFDSLWVDRDAFINPTFADNPPTIGVATLDGINEYGQPHDSTGTLEAIADYLTTQPIDLGNLYPDPTVWLSFFYQPQGLGDELEPGDSLVLQFRDHDGNWNHVWAVDGKSDTAFVRVNVNITDSIYLYKGFQFRFYNIATVNGNRDHWNLDYIILNKNTVANDSIRDVGFISGQRSPLAEYTSMPYPHYKSLGSPLGQMSTELHDTVRDINYGPLSFSYVATILDQNNNTIFNSAPNSLNSSSNTLTPVSTPLNGFYFPNNLPGDSSEFLLRTYFGQAGLSSIPYNDTNYYRQNFYNYYSYDDGSAEYVFGITANTDVRMAYLYDVKMQDTLRGVQIYWNPGGPNIHTKLFKLAYWDQVDASSNTDHLVYQRINRRPSNIDSINGFATYLFDTLLVIPPGPMWIGFIQNEPGTFYGIGFDRNTDSHSKMYYHFDGFWYQSGFEGSWMMRPLFGDTLIEPTTVKVPELEFSGFAFSLYPNPAHDRLRINFENAPGESYDFMLHNLLGEDIRAGEIFPGFTLQVSDLSPGMYVIRVSERKSGRACVKKLIVR